MFLDTGVARTKFSRPNQTPWIRRLRCCPCYLFRRKHRRNGFVNCGFLSPVSRSLVDALRNDREAAYRSWLEKRPSALKTIDCMLKAAKGKKIVVFLDYDGTLSPIVDNPDRAFMTRKMREAVKQVSKYFPTAIISGRSTDKVKEFVRLQNLYYAGSHGMDIMAPKESVSSWNSHAHLTLDRKGNEVLFQPAKKFLPMIQEMIARIQKEIVKIQGARVEDNKFCVSVHYRQVKEEDLEMLEQKVVSVLQDYPDFRITRGKMVIEIRPSIEWNKGSALEYLLETLGLKDSSDVLPLYIGDDRTDEDAFEVIRKRGQGYPIIVSSIPKETRALHSLRDPSQVLAFLERLARWGKASSPSGRCSNRICALAD
ncbi:hypothetical protein MLD38_019847 [Melastoma candidum]|uniref:Uncharacterized protein n=1 Tax=Melastoma candidum TaxID=119954 RepID=A0ACB9QCZ2_9MYRT|nr:hypothetical protein MLD38_019847 [Melastoma candidum]